MAGPVPRAWPGWLEQHLHTWRRMADPERQRFLELLQKADSYTVRENDMSLLFGSRPLIDFVIESPAETAE